jgi:hypothetical protein
MTRPLTPNPLATPIMDSTMDYIQRFWIRPEWYPRYINEVFQTIVDIRKIEGLYREGELGYFFHSLVFPRFEIAIDSDTSNWNLISQHLSSGETGRIVRELLDINIMASQVYQENIIRIARMRTPPDITAT